VRKITQLLKNRDFILSLALVIGLLFPGASVWTRHLTLPALALVMTLSTMGISGSFFRSPRPLIVPALIGILMTYGVLAVFILGASVLVIDDRELLNGFIILALMPPAVAIIPFTDLLRGNKTFSLAGTVGGYLAALLVLPIALYIVMGSGHSILERLAFTALVLMALPLVVSRFLVRHRIGTNLERFKGVITNWSFFVVVYTIVGLNQDVIMGEPLRLLPVVGIAVASMFVLGFIIEWSGKLFKNQCPDQDEPGPPGDHQKLRTSGRGSLLPCSAGKAPFRRRYPPSSCSSTSSGWVSGNAGRGENRFHIFSQIRRRENTKP